MYRAGVLDVRGRLVEGPGGQVQPGRARVRPLPGRRERGRPGDHGHGSGDDLPHGLQGCGPARLCQWSEVVVDQVDHNHLFNHSGVVITT